VALYSDLPVVLDWVVSVVMLGLCVGMGMAATLLADKWRAGVLNRQADSQSDPALV
jgi:hypothetical protein